MSRHRRPDHLDRAAACSTSRSRDDMGRRFPSARHAGGWSVRDGVGQLSAGSLTVISRRASVLLRAFCVAFNDGLERRARQRLRPYLARTIGTRDDGLDEERSWMAMDWLIRVYAPAWLELMGVCEAARGLALVAPVRGVGDLPGALEALEPARARCPRCSAGSGAPASRRAGAPSGRWTLRPQGGLGRRVRQRSGSSSGSRWEAPPGERARAGTRRSRDGAAAASCQARGRGRGTSSTAAARRRADYDRR